MNFAQKDTQRVFISPDLFKECDDFREFYASMVHEASHCDDCYNGMELAIGTLDENLINYIHPETFKTLTEVRAIYFHENYGKFSSRASGTVYYINELLSGWMRCSS